jgi:hypothetical protein
VDGSAVGISSAAGQAPGGARSGAHDALTGITRSVHSWTT